MANILIIEDQDTLRQLYRYVLQQFDHQVMLASNGEEGIAAAEENRPDLVILDLLLPGLPGIGVAQKLRESGILPGTPLIITTALEEGDARSIGESLNAVALLSKPFNIQVMLDTVQQALSAGERVSSAL